MSDDLVKRLRAKGYDTLAGFKIKQECADRIEALQAEIEQLQDRLSAADKQIEYLESEIENLEYEMCELENNP